MICDLKKTLILTQRLQNEEQKSKILGKKNYPQEAKNNQQMDERIRQKMNPNRKNSKTSRRDKNILYNNRAFTKWQTGINKE